MKFQPMFWHLNEINHTLIRPNFPRHQTDRKCMFMKWLMSVSLMSSQPEVPWQCQMSRGGKKQKHETMGMTCLKSFQRKPSTWRSFFSPRTSQITEIHLKDRGLFITLALFSLLASFLALARTGSNAFITFMRLGLHLFLSLFGFIPHGDGMDVDFIQTGFNQTLDLFQMLPFQTRMTIVQVILGVFLLEGTTVRFKTLTTNAIKLCCSMFVSSKDMATTIDWMDV